MAIKKISVISVLLMMSFISFSQEDTYTLRVRQEARIDTVLYLNGAKLSIDTTTATDGQVIKRIAGVWTNGSGGEGSASVDSLTWGNNGIIHWWISGSISDSLDTKGTYILLTDSSKFISVADSGITFYNKNQTDQLINNTVKNIYTFTLPVAGTLAQSIALVSDLPDGWTLTASGTNLLIEHNLNRSLANVGVKYNQSGTIYRSLVPYQTAFNTFQDNDLNNAQIISISNYFTQYALKVHLTFD